MSLAAAAAVAALNSSAATTLDSVNFEVHRWETTATDRVVGDHLGRGDFAALLICDLRSVDRHFDIDWRQTDLGSNSFQYVLHGLRHKIITIDDCGATWRSISTRREAIICNVGLATQFR